MLAYKRSVPDAPIELEELVDLKMLPAWVNEPAPGERYARHEGEDRDRPGRERRPNRRQDRKRPPPNYQRPTSKSEAPQRRDGGERRAPRQGHRQFGDRQP